MKNAVALLGFNPELSDEEEHARFWASLNMVIPMVAQYAPVERSVEIAHFPAVPSYAEAAPLAKPYRGEVTVNVPNAAGIYFEVIGTGEAELSRGGFTYHVTWSGVSSYEPRRYLMRDILGGDGDVSIRFYGELAYNVRHLCGYDVLFSDDSNDLQSSREWIPYDMDEIVEDFGEFAQDVLHLRDLSQTPAYRLASRSVIELSSNASGCYEVRYYHRPATADADHEEVQLDLDPTLHHLVPLLVAHYLWMDDEPSKSAQYKANYDEQLALWRMRARPTAYPKVINATGW